MPSERWTTSNKAAFDISYHLIWCPKYRRTVLVNDVAERLQSLLNERAVALAVRLDTLEIMPDHVHLFVNTPPTIAPHYLVQQFKAFSSRQLRQEFPSLRSGLPTLWTRSYYCQSVGHLSHDAVHQYLEAQKYQ